jgi:thiamine transport system substrate-binding protein
MKNLPIISIILAIVLLLPACTPSSGGLQPPPTSSPPAVLTVLTHDSFSASEKVITYFESQNNVKVSFIKSGDAGALLNRAILTKNSPLADVLYGVDNTFLSRALESGIYEAYASPLLGQVADEYKLDPQNRALPVDFGDVCVNYDKVYFANKGLGVPQTLEDLLKPEYKGLLVVENPATSSTGLAFLLATVAHFGPDGYLDYWRALRANGVIAVNGWETAYYTNFSGSSGKGGAAACGLIQYQPGGRGGLCRRATCSRADGFDSW